MNALFLEAKKDRELWGAQAQSHGRGVLRRRSPVPVFVSVAIVACSALEAIRAATIDIAVSLEPRPENAAIYVGDTVLWSYRREIGTAQILSYTGEWESPFLRSGEAFSHTFTRPGTYVYRINNIGIGSTIGSITVQPLPDGGRPGISIVTPPDGFAVWGDGAFLIQAVVSNTVENVQAVSFFQGEELIGTATTAPYEMFVRVENTGETHEFRAEATYIGGQTEISPPIRLTFQAGKVFKPMFLHGGQFVFFFSTPGTPDCILSTQDLGVPRWEWRWFAGQIKGRAIVVDERATNSPARFYRMESCL
jgi:plastocyanin